MTLKEKKFRVDVFIVNFEQILEIVFLFSLSTLNK